MREIIFIQIGNCGNKVGEKVSDEILTFNESKSSFFCLLFSFGRLFPMNIKLTDVDVSVVIASFPIRGWTCILSVDPETSLFPGIL